MKARLIDCKTNIISVINTVNFLQIPSELQHQVQLLKNQGYSNFSFFCADVGIEGTNPRINTFETCYLLTYTEPVSSDFLVTALNFSEALSKYASEALLVVLQFILTANESNVSDKSYDLGNWKVSF